MKSLSMSLSLALCLYSAALTGQAFGQDEVFPDSLTQDEAIPDLPVDESSDFNYDYEDAEVDTSDLSWDFELPAPANQEMSLRKFVGVPSNYVYNPDLGTLHDYCSYSPDSYLKADFRGPCARHDLCYGGPTDKKKCDVNLRNDLRANCDSAYGSVNPVRYTCHAVANRYFAAVVIHH